MASTSASRSSIVPPLAAALALAAPAVAQIQVSDQAANAGLVGTQHPHPLSSMGWVMGGAGAADFDRDGLADVWFANGCGVVDNLYMNQGGTFVDEAAAWGLTDLWCSQGVAAGDYNDDGWIDAYVTTMGDGSGIHAKALGRLYENSGVRSFTDVAERAGVDLVTPSSHVLEGPCWGDYDLDGDLDLFVTCWEEFTYGNRLFRNEGDGTFEDVTYQSIDILSLAPIFGFQGAFVDMNGDLYPELLVAADFKTSRYYANDGDGTFTDLTVPSGCGIDENGMGQTVGDFHNDGMLDWYVSSIHSEVFYPGWVPGNMLYRQTGSHAYDEVGVASGVDDGGWGWGTVAVDLDQDTWLDIVEVNGEEFSGEWTAEPAKLFRNEGGGSFVEGALDAGLNSPRSGRCVITFDGENDGDLDVLIVSNQAPIDYFRNDTPNAGHWIQVALDTSGHPLLAPDGYGATVRATIGGVTQTRVLNGSPSFLGTSDLVLHFGLGDATSIDELSITWPRGQVTRLEDVAADQRLLVEAPRVEDVNADGQVDVLDARRVMRSLGPADDALTLPCDVDGDGQVTTLDAAQVLLAGQTGPVIDQF